MAPGRQPADIVAAKSRRTAGGRCSEYLRGRRGLDVFREDPRHDGGQPHLLDEVMRRDIRSYADINTGTTIAAEVFHAMSIARERGWTMRDRGPASRQQSKVLMAMPMQPGMFVDEDGMAQDGARSEDTYLVRPLHRRFAVPFHHFMELVHALRAMRGEWQVSLAAA